MQPRKRCFQCDASMTLGHKYSHAQLCVNSTMQLKCSCAMKSAWKFRTGTHDSCGLMPERLCLSFIWCMAECGLPVQASLISLKIFLLRASRLKRESVICMFIHAKCMEKYGANIDLSYDMSASVGRNCTIQSISAH